MGRITEEIDAGACGLDGEELTQALLQENQELIDHNRSLHRANLRGAICLAVLVVGFLVVLVFTR